MKQLLKYLILLLALMLPATAVAHNFEVDGIYYNRKNSNEVAVTYKGTSCSQYSNEYSGRVVIPATVTYNGTTYFVTTIGESAFEGCTSLTGVTIGNSVTSISDNAFYRCSGLTSVTIPNSVTTIGNNVFDKCSGLTSVSIGSSVTSIGYEVFFDCSGLTSITVVSDNAKYDSRNNCNAIIETASNKLIIGCKKTSIPNSVTTIGYCAFLGCSGLTSVTIPNSVTTIDVYAFGYCI